VLHPSATLRIRLLLDGLLGNPTTVPTLPTLLPVLEPNSHYPFQISAVPCPLLGGPGLRH